MILIADASALVGELLRSRGKMLIQNPLLELYVTPNVWSETQHEVARRAVILEDRGVIPQGSNGAFATATLTAAHRSLTEVTEAPYDELEAEARRRIPRDPSDWPTVALALSLKAAIWTVDGDFLGCGVPTWTTETLIAHLAHDYRPNG